MTFARIQLFTITLVFYCSNALPSTLPLSHQLICRVWWLNWPNGMALKNTITKEVIWGWTEKGKGNEKEEDVGSDKRATSSYNVLAQKMYTNK